MVNKNEEILNVLEDNKKFKVIRLFEDVVYAKDNIEAVKKVKKLNKNHPHKTLMEVKVINEKDYFDFERRWGLAVSG